MKHIVSIIFAFCLVALPLNAMAQDGDFVSGGVGVFDVIDGDRSIDIRGEYRPDKTLIWRIKPWAGGEITTEGSIWAGGGLLADFNLSENYYITPSFGVGLYKDGGDDTDLDYPIQFRSQLETGRKLSNGGRFGVAFSHLSNADLGDNNPGAEVLNLYYHVPYHALFSE